MTQNPMSRIPMLKRLAASAEATLLFCVPMVAEAQSARPAAAKPPGKTATLPKPEKQPPPSPGGAQEGRVEEVNRCELVVVGKFRAGQRLVSSKGFTGDIVVTGPSEPGRVKARANGENPQCAALEGQTLASRLIKPNGNELLSVTMGVGSEQESLQGAHVIEHGRRISTSWLPSSSLRFDSYPLLLLSHDALARSLGVHLEGHYAQSLGSSLSFDDGSSLQFKRHLIRAALGLRLPAFDNALVAGLELSPFEKHGVAISEKKQGEFHTPLVKPYDCRGYSARANGRLMVGSRWRLGIAALYGSSPSCSSRAVSLEEAVRLEYLQGLVAGPGKLVSATDIASKSPLKNGRRLEGVLEAEFVEGRFVLGLEGRYLKVDAVAETLQSEEWSFSHHMFSGLLKISFFEPFE